jgi:hypothetical protein
MYIFSYTIYRVVLSVNISLHTEKFCVYVSPFRFSFNRLYNFSPFQFFNFNSFFFSLLSSFTCRIDDTEQTLLVAVIYHHDLFAFLVHFKYFFLTVYRKRNALFMKLNLHFCLFVNSMSFSLSLFSHP